MQMVVSSTAWFNLTVWCVISTKTTKIWCFGFPEADRNCRLCSSQNGSVGRMLLSPGCQRIPGCCTGESSRGLGGVWQKFIQISNRATSGHHTTPVLTKTDRLFATFLPVCANPKCSGCTDSSKTGAWTSRGKYLTWHEGSGLENIYWNRKRADQTFPTNRPLVRASRQGFCLSLTDMTWVSMG